ncbi:MAG: HEPN domain-containing protein [Actinomycetota bacterium]|uniref:ApeA N-terminal domain 1-containing protein n=1 Tax=Pseudonocardia sp. UM4_GMWB1 TaxID=2212989 RepID=UPI00307EB8B0
MKQASNGAMIGRWWIDDDPERTLAGTLVMDGDYELQVLGSFKALTPDGFAPSVIRGVCAGQFITLVEVSARHDVPKLAASGTSTYYCPVVLIGHRDLTGTSTAFDQVDVTHSRMTTFAGRTGIAEHDTDTSSVLRFTPLESLHAVDGQGRTYQLDGDFTAAYPEPGRRVSWTERENLLVHLPAALTVTQILQTVERPVRHLLHLACGHPSGIEMLRLAHSPATPDDLMEWHTVHIFQKYPNRGEDEQTPADRCLLTLADIDFATVVPKWMGLAAKLDISLDLLLSLDGPHAGFVSNRFFSAAAAAEGIHRRLNPEREQPSPRHTNRMTAILAAVQEPKHNKWLDRQLRGSHRLDFSSRLRLLHREACPAIKPYIPDADKWSTAVVHMRDMVAHSLPDENRDARAFHYLATSIDLVVRIGLLRRIGLDPDVIARRVENNNQWAHLKGGLRAAVPEIF